MDLERSFYNAPKRHQARIEKSPAAVRFNAGSKSTAKKKHYRKFSDFSFLNERGGQPEMGSQTPGWNKRFK